MNMLSKFGFLKRKAKPEYDWINHLTVECSDADAWYIVQADGEPYAGPYKTAGAAKGQLTRLRQGYTPAAKRDLNDDRNNEA